jgi:hypothetical protein
MTRLLAMSLLALCCCKGHAAASPMPSDAPDDSHKNWEGHGGLRGCRLNAEADCGSGRLPRVTEKEWTPASFEQAFKRSAEGTIAVDYKSGAAQLVAGCRLPGTYTEAQGEPGSGRFWATDRLLFKVTELGSECQTATHAIAAFAVRGVEGGRIAKEGGAMSPVKIGASLRVSALLVPLPCPPTSDPAPAKGCVGRGLTGPQRKKRAVDTWHDTLEEAHRRDLADLFEVYAFLPDDPRGLEYLGSKTRKARIDCFLANQIFAARSNYPVEKWGHFQPDNEENCEAQPPFLTCFPGLFEPAPSDVACWRPAP